MPEWLDQLQELLRYHLPSGEVSLPPMTVLVALAVGVALCLVGARLVRTCVVLAFGGCGAYAGAQAAQSFGQPTVLGVLIGAAVLAIVGYLLFRLWVASLSGFVFAALAIGVFAMPQLPTLLKEYDAQRTGATAEAGFVLLTPDEQQSYLRQSGSEYVRGFVDYVRTTYPEIVHRALFLSTVAFLLGAAIGLFAYGWAMILATSTAGTLLLVAALWTLANTHWPYAIEWCQANPRPVGAVLLIWFALSVLVQWRGMQRSLKAVQAAPAANPA